MAPDLVGRDAEVEAITRRVVAAGAGRGGMVLVAGEPGIGKTRLAQEVAELARQRGMCSVWGRCRETGDTPPYWPWTQVLRAVLAAHPTKGAAAKDLEPLLRAEPARDADRFRSFDAVTRLRSGWGTRWCQRAPSTRVWSGCWSRPSTVSTRPTATRASG